MYYKIIKDGYVIDVCNSWGKLSRRGNIILCNYEEAQFMLGREPDLFPYRIEWLMPLPDNAPRFEQFESVYIEQEEYERLLHEFNDKESIIYQPEENIIEKEDVIEAEISSPEHPSQILTYGQLVQRVDELTTKLTQLLEQNRLLEDCILEISQKLYQ